VKLLNISEQPSYINQEGEFLRLFLLSTVVSYKVISQNKVHKHLLTFITQYFSFKLFNLSLKILNYIFKFGLYKIVFYEILF